MLKTFIASCLLYVGASAIDSDTLELAGTFGFKSVPTILKLQAKALSTSQFESDQLVLGDSKYATSDWEVYRVKQNVVIVQSRIFDQEGKPTGQFLRPTFSPFGSLINKIVDAPPTRSDIQDSWEWADFSRDGLEVAHVQVPGTNIKLCINEDNTELEFATRQDHSCVWVIERNKKGASPPDFTKPIDNGENQEDDRKKQEDEGENQQDDSQLIDERVDAATEIIGLSNDFINSLEHYSKRDNTELKIQNVIRLYALSKEIYDKAMSDHLNAVYQVYDKDQNKSLSRDEAIDYLYHVLGVKRQNKGLAIAKAAAKISGSDDEMVDKNEMEEFLYRVFSDQLDDTEYQTQSELGINITL